MGKYNTFPRRLLAGIIDGIFLYPISFLESLYINKGVSLFAIGTFATGVIYSLYFIILHAKYGHTIGKIITGLKVLDISELRLINFKKSILRESPFVVINLAIILYVIALLGDDLSKTEERFHNITYTINLIWIGLEIIYMLTNKKRRAIHDVIADSVVIKVPA